MPEFKTSGRDLLAGGSRFLGHGVAVVAGLVLMILGIAMGVTIAMLPVGIPVGLAGLAVFLWGLFGQAK